MEEDCQDIFRHVEENDRCEQLRQLSAGRVTEDFCHFVQENCVNFVDLQISAPKSNQQVREHWRHLPHVPLDL